jgi:hypothetical protein
MDVETASKQAPSANVILSAAKDLVVLSAAKDLVILSAAKDLDAAQPLRLRFARRTVVVGYG